MYVAPWWHFDMNVFSRVLRTYFKYLALEAEEREGTTFFDSMHPVSVLLPYCIKSLCKGTMTRWRHWLMNFKTPPERRWSLHYISIFNNYLYTHSYFCFVQLFKIILQCFNVPKNNTKNTRKEFLGLLKSFQVVQPYSTFVTKILIRENNSWKSLLWYLINP